MRNYFKDTYWLMRSKTFDGLSLCHRMLYEYSNRRFAAADRYLRHLAKERSVWEQYKRFFKGSENQPPPYGETPLLTMRRIVERFAIEPHQCVLDFGSGSGRVALWLATQVGCRVIGVEQVSSLVQGAIRAAKSAGMKEKELMFLEGDLQQAPLEEADIVYFYGLGLSDEIYDRLVLKIASLPSPPWVITIGGPLSEYCERFNVIQKTPVVFPWGWTNAYLNVYVPVGKELKKKASHSEM